MISNADCSDASTDASSSASFGASCGASEAGETIARESEEARTLGMTEDSDRNAVDPRTVVDVCSDANAPMVEGLDSVAPAFDCNKNASFPWYKRKINAEKVVNATIATITTHDDFDALCDDDKGLWVWDDSRRYLFILLWYRLWRNINEEENALNTVRSSR